MSTTQYAVVRDGQAIFTSEHLVSAREFASAYTRMGLRTLVVQIVDGDRVIVLDNHRTDN